MPSILKRTHLIIVLLVAVGGCLGCGGAPRTQVRAPEAVTMEPVRVTAHRSPEGDVELDAYDARDLLRRGNQALSERRCDDAVASYDQLLREFQDSRLVSAAHYNAALCLEHTEQLEEAAERYLMVVTDSPDSSDVRDAFFQATRCYERLEQWQRSISVLDQVMSRTDLSPDEQIEAMARRGTALIHQGRYDDGQVQLRRAVAFYRNSSPDAVATDYYLAQAQYYLGEAPRIQMGEVGLTSDESQFRQALDLRCELVLRAQTQYVQAIRMGNAHWGAASAYRIGEMYSSLFDDVMEVPVGDIVVPPDLVSPEEIQAFLEEFPRHYRRLLRQRLEPLLHNAIRWWESNLMMIERTGISGEWVERTRGNLDRVRSLLANFEEDDAAGGNAVRSDPSSTGSSTEPSGNTVD